MTQVRLIPILQIDIQDFDNAWLAQSDLSQLEWVNPMYKHWNENFKCFMYIRAPFETKDQIIVPIEKRNIHNQAQAPVRQIYMDRTGTRDMKRGLCQFPTLGSAEEAGMSLEAFLRVWCRRGSQGLEAAWLTAGEHQASQAGGVFEGAL